MMIQQFRHSLITVHAADRRSIGNISGKAVFGIQHCVIKAGSAAAASAIADPSAAQHPGERFIDAVKITRLVFYGRIFPSTGF